MKTLFILLTVGVIGYIIYYLYEQSSIVPPTFTKPNGYISEKTVYSVPDVQLKPIAKSENFTQYSRNAPNPDKIQRHSPYIEREKISTFAPMRYAVNYNLQPGFYVNS